MSFTLLSVIIIIVGALIVVRQVCVGHKVGFIRSVIRTALFILSAVFAPFISDLFSDAGRDLIGGAVRYSEIIVYLERDFGELGYLSDVISDMLGALLIYVPTFFLLFGLFSLITKIAYRRSVEKKEGGDYVRDDAPYFERNSKGLGAAMGIVSGLLVTLVVFSPVAGLFKTGESFVGVLEKFGGGETIEKDEDSEFYVYADDLMLNVIYSSGGGTLFDLTAVLRGSEKSSSIKEEIEYLSTLDGDAFETIVKSIDFSDGKVFKDILDRSRESVIFEAIAYCAVTNAAEAWRDGRAYMGVENPMPDVTSAFNNFTRELLWVCSVSSPYTFRDNVETLMNITEIVADKEGEFGTGDYRDEIDAVVGGNAMDRIRDELTSNPNTETLVQFLDRIVISTLTEELMNPESYSDAARETLFSDIAYAINYSGHLSGEERIVTVAGHVKDAFSRFNMYLPEGVDEELSERLLNEIFYYGSVNQDTIRYFFYNYLSY